jgi:hypothetical protein
MVVSGLNIATGAVVLPDSVRRGDTGNREIVWNYCFTRSKANSLYYLVPISGTFIDAWKTY